MANCTGVTSNPAVSSSRDQFDARFHGDIYHAGVTRELRNRMYQSGTESAGFAGLKWMHEIIRLDHLSD